MVATVTSAAAIAKLASSWARVAGRGVGSIGTTIRLGNLENFESFILNPFGVWAVPSGLEVRFGLFG